MKKLSPHLMKLVKLLAENFPHLENIRTILGHASIPVSEIALSAKPIDTWNDILKFAIKQGQFVNLIQTCLDIEGNIPIKEVYYSYLESEYTSFSQKIMQPEIVESARIDELDCKIELLDVKTARHTYAYKLSNFGDDIEEKTFYFFAKDVLLNDLKFEWGKWNGDNIPEGNVEIFTEPKGRGVTLIFKEFLSKNKELKTLEFCYTSPSFAHLYKCKETAVVSYRSEFFHEMFTNLIHLTIELPRGSTIVNHSGRVIVDPDDGKIMYTETEIKKGDRVGFPILFCNSNFRRGL